LLQPRVILQKFNLLVYNFTYRDKKLDVKEITKLKKTTDYVWKFYMILHEK